MRVDTFKAEMIVANTAGCCFQLHGSVTKMEGINEASVSTDNECVPAKVLEGVAEAPSKDDDTVTDDDTRIFHTCYAEGRQYHQSFQFGAALEQYKKALQCKYRTIQSEPYNIREKFCSTLYNIGKIHLESEWDDDPMRGIEAMHFCLNTRRSCFGSSHPSLANLLIELATIR
jgi:hypothetical protein